MLKRTYIILKHYIHHAVLDLRYGGKILRGSKKSPFSHLGAYPTANSDYLALSKLFQKVKIKDTDVIVDIGCGKGRVFNYLLSLKIRNKMIGVELDQQIAEETKNRLKKYKNIKIIHGDILENIPYDATIFYMFNPFDENIMYNFKKQIEEIFKGRKITIIYYNPKHISLFYNDLQWHVEIFDAEGYGDHNKYRAAILNFG
jgi:SAM-dependent methyltransferase